MLGGRKEDNHWRSGDGGGEDGARTIKVLEKFHRTVCFEENDNSLNTNNCLNIK